MTLHRLSTNELTQEIIGAAMEVHSQLGPGLLESGYQACLAHELRLRGLTVAEQLPLPVTYKGVHVELGYRIDQLVNEAVVVELKAVAKLHKVYEAQLLSHMKLSGHHVGLLINFHELHLKDGIKRLLN